MTPISLTTTEEIDGELRLNPSWAELNSVARLDLIQDWIGVLEQLYQFTHQDTYGLGCEYRPVCVNAITGWQHHGKGPSDYVPDVIRLHRPMGEKPDA
jgi:hypothetical protein